MDDQVLQPVDYSIFVPHRIETYGQVADAIVREVGEGDNLEARLTVCLANHPQRWNSISLNSLFRQLFCYKYCPYQLLYVTVNDWMAGQELRRVSADDYFSLVEQWEAEHNGRPSTAAG